MRRVAQQTAHQGRTWQRIAYDYLAHDLFVQRNALELFKYNLVSKSSRFDSRLLPDLLMLEKVLLVTLRVETTLVLEPEPGLVSSF
jgi:hypothetical protein